MFLGTLILQINDSDMFSLVTDYTNKLFRIRYKHPEVRDSTKEQEQTQDEVVRERHHCVSIIVCNKCVIYYLSLDLLYILSMFAWPVG